MTTTEPLAMGVREAAEKVRVSRDTIVRAIHAGELKAKRVGNRLSVTARALEDWHDNLPDA